ncbi:MAG TPA: iron ABC transporter permease [Lachnospiraceae bacterium]|nr:iron ABC transporter permease [Lachnospiraceae bacterium]
MRARNRFIILVLFLFLVALFLISIAIGKYPIKPKEVVGILGSRFLPIEPYWTNQMETIFYHVRLPRILLAIMVGCCLSTAGASYQGIFQNPMAAPDVLGASAGAAFGAAQAIMHHAGNRMITLSAFAFSIVTVILVYLVGRRSRGSKVLALVLAGIMVSSLFSAGTSYLKLVADPNDTLPAITYWLMGSLSGTKIEDVAFASIPMALGLIPLFLLRWQLNMLTLGDEEARTMGVNTGLIRFLTITCATLITAASVSVSGMIGWVGLVIPHMGRRLVGNNYRHLIPVTMLLGANFLLLVDNVSRNLWTSEIPIGILTAFIGAPFFLYLIAREGDVI